MPRFWQVDFYPMEAHTAVIEAHRNWTFPPVQRLAKCGTVITRAYSEALRSRAPVEAKTSWGRFIFMPDARPFAASEPAATASLGEGEIHEVPSPPLSLLDLPDQERRVGLLDCLHELLVQLAEVRGWDRQPFDQ